MDKDDKKKMVEDSDQPRGLACLDSELYVVNTLTGVVNRVGENGEKLSPPDDEEELTPEELHEVQSKLKHIKSEFQAIFKILNYEPGNSECLGEAYGWLLDSMSDYDLEKDEE